MQTVKFGNEPLDLKLMLLYMLRRIRYVVYGILLGAIFFAGFYYFAQNAFAEPVQYTARGELYLTYSEEVRIENVMINDYTWHNLIHTDKAVEYAMEYISEDLDRDYLEEVVTAGLISDVRLVTLEVTTTDPELSVEIADAFMQSIIKFGKEMADIDDITVFTNPSMAKPVLKENRIVRIALTGGLIGLFASILYTAALFLLDDSVLIPEDVRRRYGLCVVGMLTKKDAARLKDGSGFYFGKDITVEAQKRMDWKRQFMKYYFRKQTVHCKKIAVMDIGSKNDTKPCMKALNELKELLAREEAERIDHGDMKIEDAVFTSYDFVMEEVTALHDDMSGVDKLHDYDGVILLIKAGEQNGQMIASSVELLRSENCSIIGAFVYDGDTALWNQYYFTPFSPELKRIKNAEQVAK